MVGEEFAAELIDYLTAIETGVPGRPNLALASQCLGELRRPEVAEGAAMRLLNVILTSTIVDAEFWPFNLETSGFRLFHEAVANYIETIPARIAEENAVISGYLIRTLAGQSESVRRALVKRLLIADTFINTAAFALSQWRDRETALDLVRACKQHPALLRYAAISIVIAGKENPDIADWLFTQNLRDPFVSWTVVSELARDIRSLPVLEMVIRGSSSDYPEHIIPTARAALKYFAANDPSPEIRKRAAKALKAKPRKRATARA